MSQFSAPLKLNTMPLGRKKLGRTTTVTKTTRPGQRARMAAKGFYVEDNVSSGGTRRVGQVYKGKKRETKTTYVRKNKPTNVPLIGPPSGYVKPKRNR